MGHVTLATTEETALPVISYLLLAFHQETSNEYLKLSVGTMKYHYTCVCNGRQGDIPYCKPVSSMAVVDHFL